LTDDCLEDRNANYECQNCPVYYIPHMTSFYRFNRCCCFKPVSRSQALMVIRVVTPKFAGRNRSDSP